ncbi:GGDEF domain-containing protein [Comamonas resistens]|uniref:diguanylate cyclase n=1 Tax=Comamonas resistens TaxID=3046670 RepID=A0ABY8SL39_9BURK|nr:GGDEF domain-containing protein [Comamonas resistens]MDL5035032.1 GGDEF domain-containing protein [Comamonas resistens]WHS63648.1 GGDEF domain-containing protein [Comamonas resistens]
MTSSAPHQSVFLRDLRLATAHNLVTRAGGSEMRLPTDTPTQYLQALIDGLCALSLRDPLTGLGNRRHFRTVIEREIDRVARSGETALLLMLDIDHFKQINDEHGHIAGDMVLQSVAHTLADGIRPMDTLARYGGEEFAIVLPVCPAHFGHSVAERLRQSIAETPIQVSPSTSLNITVSIGGVYALQWIRSTAQLWTERADRQLYLAKSAGRNCVRIEEPPDSTVSAEEKSLLFGPLTPDAIAENGSESNTAHDVSTDAKSQVITP